LSTAAPVWFDCLVRPKKQNSIQLQFYISTKKNYNSTKYCSVIEFPIISPKIPTVVVSEAHDHNHQPLIYNWEPIARETSLPLIKRE
jgi:hypothetical protein